MNDPESQRRPFQYSLWSLLVFSTIVAVLCSIGVSTDWSIPVVIIVGVCVCLVGFHPLSLRKHPTAGIAFVVAGFFVRLIGLMFVGYGLVVFTVQIVSILRSHP